MFSMYMLTCRECCVTACNTKSRIAAEKRDKNPVPKKKQKKAEEETEEPLAEGATDVDGS